MVWFSLCWLYLLSHLVSMFRVFNSKLFASKQYRIKRVEYPWLKFARLQAWKSLHSSMISFFQRERPVRDSTVTIHARSWPAFAGKEQLLREGLVPGIVWKHGAERRVVFEKSDIEQIAFDDIGENSHISLLFKARLLNVVVDNVWLEPCVVSEVSSHVNKQSLTFLKLARHVSGKPTTVELPISLVGLFGSPASLQGAQVDLVIPSVKIECTGDKIPPPILLDVSALKFHAPYTRITMDEIEKLLPDDDGKTRLASEYTNKEEIEVVLCYEVRGIEERALPNDYQDPNFLNRKGKKYHVTYSGFWPRQ